MIDTEVTRLRHLRNTALRARAIAMALNARQIEGGSAFARSALACWRIARTVTGKLRAHPYQRYQRDAGALRSLYDGAGAAVIAAVAQYRGGSVKSYSKRLQRVARELDDARALTWSPALSDTLGRSQSEIRALIREFAADVRARADAGAAAAHTDASPRIAANWPYLAF